MTSSSKENLICCSNSYEKICPVFNVHDKLEESAFFLAQMSFYYHNSRFFRFALNAFVKSFREITFMIQTYKSLIPNFDNWYKTKQDEMKSDRLLKWLADSRTTVVHKDMLKTNSNVEAGVYRGRDLKLAISLPIDNPFIDSEVLLEKVKVFGFVDEKHSTIWEQYGVRRQWNCDGLSKEDELVKVCLYGYKKMCSLVRELHELLGLKFYGTSFDMKKISANYVLLETDVDPSLVKKWEWE